MLINNLNLTSTSQFALSSGLNSRAEFSKLRQHGLALAQWLLENSELKSCHGEIREAMDSLRSGSVSSLWQALESCHDSILAIFSERLRILVWKAGGESSPLLFAQAVREMAQVFENQGDHAASQGLYSLGLQTLPNNEENSELREKIQRDLLVLRGNGSFSESFALGLKRLPHELFSPTVLAIGVGSLSNALGTKFLGNALRSSLGQTSRVFFARAGGMAIDAFAFTGVQHGMAIASGTPIHSFTHGLLHAGLMLTSLRVTGSMARTALGIPVLKSSLKNLGILTKSAVETTLPLLAEFQGILRANQLGAKLGLGEVGAHAGLETLLTMTHFRFAQSWLKLSPHYTQIHHRLSRETEVTLQDLGSKAYQSLVEMTFKWRGPGAFGARRLGYAHETWEASHHFTEELVPLASYLEGNSVSASGERIPKLRRYQQGLLDALLVGMENQQHPWLSIVSPMQTGKSYLTGPFIRAAREISNYRNAQFLVVAYSRTAQRQVYEDLVSQFGESRVGRFGNNYKINTHAPILVVGSQTLVKNYREFRNSGPFGWDIGKRPTVIIHDEAFFSLGKGMSEVHQHFGVMNGEGKAQFGVKGSRVIGLAGTPERIVGRHNQYYKIVDTYDLLSAWQDGYVRHVDSYSLSFTSKQLPYDYKADVGLICWKPTLPNAKALVKIFKEQIYDQGAQKSLIYVPTTEHAELLFDVLRNALPKEANKIFRIHSKRPSPEVNDEALAAFDQSGGIMISVDMLNRSYRGNGVKPIDAIFLTYQTSSLELFSQRVGRGWGQDPDYLLPPLKLIEISWDRRQAAKKAMANMMRLLGLNIEHPGRFETKGKIEKIRNLRRVESAQAKLNHAAQEGELRPLFYQAPVSLAWRDAVVEALSDLTTEQYADEARLHPWQIDAYRYGAIPTRWREARPLARWLGGEVETRRLWVESWHQVLDSIYLWSDKNGQRNSHKAGFKIWQRAYQAQGASEAVAQELSDYLATQFPNTVLWETNIGELRRLLPYRTSVPQTLLKLRYKMGYHPSDRQLREALAVMYTLAKSREALHLPTGEFSDIYQHWRRVSDGPKTLNELAKEGRPGLPIDSIKDLAKLSIVNLNDMFNARFDQLPNSSRKAWVDFMQDQYGWNIPTHTILNNHEKFPFVEFPWKIRYLLHLHHVEDAAELAALDQSRFEALGLSPHEAKEALQIIEEHQQAQLAKAKAEIKAKAKATHWREAGRFEAFSQEAAEWLEHQTLDLKADELYETAADILRNSGKTSLEEKKLALQILGVRFANLPTSNQWAEAGWLNRTLAAYKDPALQEIVFQVYQEACQIKEGFLEESDIRAGLHLLADAYQRSRETVPLHDDMVFSDMKKSESEFRQAKILLSFLFPKAQFIRTWSHALQRAISGSSTELYYSSKIKGNNDS